ncbi:NepR domain-containing protein [Hyphomicrobiales bacterium]|nr:NepR domain-containing protein [Hyphomicrobiales bacterium]CAH1672619.1 NepR domain-containing protein [Hyphomicrobiales bacterium]
MGARRSADEETQELHPGNRIDGGMKQEGPAPECERGARMAHSTIALDGIGTSLSPALRGPSAQFAERLTDLYRTTLEQPVPDRFLELLDKLDRREGQE